MIIKILLLSCLILLTTQDVALNQITGVTQDNLMYTGTIGVGSQKLFFTFYGKNGQTDPQNLPKNPLVIAIGAPGRSASYINYGGMGPKLLKNDLTIIDNPNKITQYANAMFLDQLGSGFSFASDPTKIPSTSKQYGSILTSAINDFISGTDIAKSESVYLISQSTSIRSFIGIDDIDPLKAVFHVSPWPDFYQIGKFYATAGIDLKIFGQSERITIETTFEGCYRSQKSQKYLQAHQCYDSTLNYIQANTKNANLLDIPLGSNLTDFVPMVQYYLSQSAVVSTLKAPTSRLFESNSPKVQNQLYNDMAKNFDTEISQYLKDYLSVKDIFISGDDDFINYRKGIRDWLENKLDFVGVDTFRPMAMKEFSVDGKVAGYTKGVDQVKYFQVLNTGHYPYNTQSNVINQILKQTIVSKSLYTQEILLEQ